jgi:hypothetical protein
MEEEGGETSTPSILPALPNRSKKTGTTTMLRKVEVRRPPIVTIVRGV